MRFVTVNDIAILRLNVAFDYDKYGCVQPLCLPSANQSFPAGTVCTVAGWGVTEPEYDSKDNRHFTLP